MNPFAIEEPSNTDNGAPGLLSAPAAAAADMPPVHQPIPPLQPAAPTYISKLNDAVRHMHTHFWAKNLMQGDALTRWDAYYTAALHGSEPLQAAAMADLAYLQFLARVNAAPTTRQAAER